MTKSLVGKIKNKKFAFFWLLIGGSLGNVLLIIHSPSLWRTFLPSAALSILMAIAIMDNTNRPKLWLAIDTLLAAIPLILLVPYFGAPQTNPAILLPSALIILGCILGIMDW